MSKTYTGYIAKSVDGTCVLAWQETKYDAPIRATYLTIINRKFDTEKEAVEFAKEHNITVVEGSDCKHYLT